MANYDLNNLFNRGISSQPITGGSSPVYGPANPATGAIGGMGGQLPSQPINASGGVSNPNPVNLAPPGNKKPTTTQGQTLGVNVGASSLPGGGGGGGGASVDIAGLEAAYQDYSKALEGQAATTTAQYGQATTDVQNQYSQSIADIGRLKATGVENLQNATSTVNQSSQNAVSDARRAYNELQQRNQAYLSAGGISSSSAAEALQEGLSKQTLSALNNITQNKDQTLQNIATQQKSLQDFYDQQIANLDTGLASAKSQIGLQLRAAIDQINTTRSLAEKDKAIAKNQLLAQASAANSAAAQQASQIKANLDAFNGIKQQVFGQFNGYANGQISLQDFAAGLKSTNDKLRGTGVQLNTAAIAAGVANPYVAASNNNWFIEEQQTPPVLGQPGLVPYNASTGKQIQ